MTEESHEVDTTNNESAVPETEDLPTPTTAVDDQLDNPKTEQTLQNLVASCDDLDDPDERIKRRRRYYLLVFAFLCIFFFSGAFFGWGPMQLLLEENGSYSSKCTDEEQTNQEICPSQSAALVRIHFAGTVSQFISPLLGAVVDRYGPAFLSYLMGICGCVGVALLIVAAQSDADWLLFAAFLAIANSTWMVSRLTLYQ